MDRRSFLTGVIGIAGAAVFVARPTSAMAGLMPGRDGVLDELDEPASDLSDGEGNQVELEPVQYRRERERHWRRDHRDYYRRHHRPHRRRVWRRVCRSYWRHGRRHVRCFRKRVWVWR